MWNGHLGALQRPNFAVPDRGSILKINQFAVLHNIVSVVGVFFFFETLFRLTLTFVLKVSPSDEKLGI